MEETVQAIIAFHDYKEMGPERSLSRLHAHYLAVAQSDSDKPLPTTSLRTIKHWSTTHSWQRRIKRHERAQVGASRLECLRICYHILDLLTLSLRVAWEEYEENPVTQADINEFRRLIEQVDTDLRGKIGYFEATDWHPHIYTLLSVIERRLEADAANVGENSDSK